MPISEEANRNTHIIAHQSAGIIATSGITAWNKIPRVANDSFESIQMEYALSVSFGSFILEQSM